MRDGSTDWQALGVGEMWSMLAAHDGAAHQHLIGGWRRSFELVLQHLSGVRRYRAGLAAAWPPETSAASAAYMERLDALIASLWETYEAAVENHRALTGATGALNGARAAMAEIHREYAGNEARLAEFREQQRVYQLVGGKAKGAPPQSPIPDGRQAALEQQARTVMASLSAELASAQISIVRPKPYQVPLGMETKGRNLSPKAPGPPLPLPAPRVRPSGHHRQVAQQEHQIPLAPDPQSVTPRNQAAPILSNVYPPVIAGPEPAGRPMQPYPSTTAGVILQFEPEEVPPLVATPPPGGRGPTNPHSIPDASPIGSSPPRNSPAPPGSIIGGMPVGGQPTASQSTRQPHRINPVGGVIGQPPPSSAERTRRRRDIKGRDHDYYWETSKSVDPVITSPPDRKIDPGPVIGLD